MTSFFFSNFPGGALSTTPGGHEAALFLIRKSFQIQQSFFCPRFVWLPVCLLPASLSLFFFAPPLVFRIICFDRTYFLNHARPGLPVGFVWLPWFVLVLFSGAVLLSFVPVLSVSDFLFLFVFFEAFGLWPPQIQHPNGTLSDFDLVTMVYSISFSFRFPPRTTRAWFVCEHGVDYGG